MSLGAPDPFRSLRFSVYGKHTEYHRHRQLEIQLQNAIGHGAAHPFKMRRIAPDHTAEGDVRATRAVYYALRQLDVEQVGRAS